MKKFATYIILSYLFSCTLFAQVGIDTTDPKATLDVNGAISMREGQPLILSSGDNTDINLSSLGTIYSNYRITGPLANFNIQTFTIPLPALVADGQLLTLINTTLFNMVIENEQGSAVDSQISTPGGKDILLTGINSTITFQYNIFEKKWIVLNVGDSFEVFPINSFSLNDDILINSATYIDIQDANLSFVAKNTSALISFSASGTGMLSNGNLSTVYLQAVNTQNNLVLGATSQNIQAEHVEVPFITIFYPRVKVIPFWSAGFEKQLVGLNVGQTYTFKVQGKILRKLQNGTIDSAWIKAGSIPDDNHLTLAVFQ